MSWTTIYRFRAPIDPDYGGAPMTIAVLRDNMGGLVLEMNVGDGEVVIAEPISDAVAQDLARAMDSSLPTPVLTDPGDGYITAGDVQAAMKAWNAQPIKSINERQVFIAQHLNARADHARDRADERDGT